MAFTHGRKADVLIDEFNLTRFFKMCRIKNELEVVDGTCFGSTAKEYGVGFPGGDCSLEGLFKAIDPLIVDAAEVLSDAIGSANSPIVSIGPAGIDAVGDVVRMFQGDEQQHDVVASIQNLTMITAQFLASQGIRRGLALAPIANYSASGNGASVDNTLASDNGAVAHLHVTSAAGTTPTIDWIVQHSVDNAVWVDLITFTQATDVTVERLSVTGTVNRYLRAKRTIGGTGSPNFDCAVAVARL